MRQSPGPLRGLTLAIALSACTPQAVPEATELIQPEPDFGVMPFVPPPGYPPQIGTLTGQKGGEAFAFGTYDFSVGAVDPSAWIGQRDGQIVLHVGAYADPDRQEGRITIETILPGPPVAGLAGTDVVVRLARSEDHDGPHEVSQPGAELLLQAVTPPAEGEIYGRIAGEVTATLCLSANAEPSPAPAWCAPFTAQFDTEAHFEF